MSESERAEPRVVYVQATEGSNGVGLAGFILSVCGLLMCGVFCPLGLLFSCVGLLRAPRGFAVAGSIVGLVGTLGLFGAIGAAGVFGVACAEVGRSLVPSHRQSAASEAAEAGRAAAERRAADNAAREAEAKLEAARQVVNEAYEAIERLRGGGVIPGPASGQKAIAALRDPWGHPIEYRWTKTQYTVVSIGPDGRPDTPDDLTRSH